MAIKQVSVLLDNQKGSLLNIVSALAEARVDLRSICVADTEDYGIIRMIVDDSVKAEKTLNAMGLLAKIREVVAVSVPDEPGGLAKVLSTLAENDMNIEYMYSIINGSKDSAYMVLRVRDNEKAEAVLKKIGVTVLTEDNIRK